MTRVLEMTGLRFGLRWGGSGGNNKDGLKTCCHFDERGEENLLSSHSGKRCHFDERSEEKSCVPPKREGKISRCARNDMMGEMTGSVGVHDGRE